MGKLLKIAIMFAIPLAMWFITPPEGLSVEAWRLLGFYLMAIVGLVVKPWPAPIILLLSIAGSAIFLNATKNVLSGYASTTVWLVFSAFSLSVAFVKTGLGRRIAYLLIKSLGHTTLRLGYVTALLDFIISPVTPSNTARCGGIVFPIMNSVAKALGSEPGESAKKAGSYLMVNTYMVTKVTSLMFATAMAPNLLAADYMNKILGVDINWGLWALALVVPGLVMLLITPALVYYLDKPSIQHIDSHGIADEGLKELGPMSGREKSLIAIFILALVGWALPSILTQGFGIKFSLDATAVAIVAMVAALVTGVIKWEDMLESKGAWNTLIWFGGIIGMSSALSKVKFFEWLADFIGTHFNFGDNPMLALIIIGAISIAVRYLFASGSAYVVAMLPVFLTVGKVAGVNPMALSLLLAATNSYGGALTHYGGAAAPIVFGAGYNTVKSWWIIGGIFAIMCFIVNLTVGYAWWEILGIL